MTLVDRQASLRDYRQKVRGLNLEAVTNLRDDFRNQALAELRLTSETALIELRSYRNNDPDNRATYDFVISSFEENARLPKSQRWEMTGMLGYFEQLLYDMGARE